MSPIPNAPAVDRALRNAKREVKASLKATFAEAGRRMARAKTHEAQALAEKAQGVRQFAADLDVLQKRWREIRRSQGHTSRNKKTPLWRFYQPILQALVECDGEATQDRLVTAVEPRLRGVLLEGDLDLSVRGVARWHGAVRRAQRAMTAEGWLEPDCGRTWRITATGRRAATAPQSDVAPDRSASRADGTSARRGKGGAR